MNSKSFNSELDRAYARDDIDQLRKSLAIYRDWIEHQNDDFPDEINCWFDGGENFDKGLALVVLAAATYDDPQFLCVVAAGILEDLITKQTPLTLEKTKRIVEESRKNPRFRWMLSGVWTTSAAPSTQEAVTAAIGAADCDRDELPPSSWA